MSTRDEDAWRFPNRATRPGASSYYALRLTPAERRDEWALLFAWHRELRAVLVDCSDPGVARLKLQWWREELARAYGGAAQHPLAKALMPVLRQRNLPRAPFDAMAEAVEAEVRRLRPVDLPALERHCRQDQGGLFELLARAQGETDPARLEAASRLGAGCALVCLIRDLGGRLRRDQDPLPLDLAVAAGPPNPAREAAYGTALARLGAEAQVLLEEGLHPVPHGLRILTRLRAALLRELAGSGFPVLHQRVSLTPVRKLWIAWRTPRKHPHE